jgi:hypothetical protein
MQSSCVLRLGGTPDRKSWSRHEVFRPDVFIFANPADEGCDFTIDYTITVGVSYGEQ